MGGNAIEELVSQPWHTLGLTISKLLHHKDILIHVLIIIVKKWWSKFLI